MIRKRGDKYVVLSEKKDKKGNRKNLGSAKTLAAAKKRLQQIHYFEHKKG